MILILLFTCSLGFPYEKKKAFLLSARVPFIINIPFANGFPRTPIYEVPTKKFERLTQKELLVVTNMPAFCADNIIFPKIS